MKQLISYVAIVSLLVGLATTSVSFAEETGSAPTTTTTRAHIQSDRQAITDTREAMVTTMQQNRDTMRAARTETLQTVDALRAQITERKTDMVQEMSAIRATTQLRLADMPAWTHGVCQSTNTNDAGTDEALCTTIRAELKDKCVTLEMSLAHTSDSSAVAQGCASVDTLSCTDIVNACANVRTAVQNRETNIEELRARIAEKSADVAQKLEERKAALDAKLTALTEQAKERIQAYGVRVAERITAAFDRLALLADRIDSRTAKIKTDYPNIDLSAATTAIASARTHIQQGRDILATATTNLPDALAGDNARSATDVVRETFTQAADEARAAKSDIVSALDAITAALTNAGITTTDTTTTE